MSRIIWVLSKASPAGILIVLIFAGCALIAFFTHFENPVARWLCAAFFVLYWPRFVRSNALANSEFKDDDDLRTRRYVAKNTLLMLSPLFRYSYSRDAFVLRGVGRSVGPVLRLDRRRLRDARPRDGIERRAPRIA